MARVAWLGASRLSIAILCSAGCGTAQSTGGLTSDGSTARLDSGSTTADGGRLDGSNGADGSAGGDPGDASFGEAGDGDGPRAPASGLWVTGYYAAYQRDSLPPEDIDWSGLSHIVLTRIKNSANGTLALDFDVDNVNGPALARDLARRAHQHGVKALLMLGGAGEGASIRSACSSANRPGFVTALLQAVRDLGYDGIDLDWEDDVDYELFVALARDLRASPNAPAGLLLTAPGSAINGNYQVVEPKVAQLVENLDQYNLMTYHPATALAGGGWLSWHNAALSGVKGSTPVAIDDSLQRHVTAGVPKAKLGLGTSFYAICYTGGVTAPNQSTERGVEIVGGDNDYPLSELFSSQGAFRASYRHWDDVAKVPYLTLPAPDSRSCRYVSFEDEQSLEAKGEFTRREGYGGIIVWTLNQGYLTGSSKAPHALTQALKRGFLDP